MSARELAFLQGEDRLKALTAAIALKVKTFEPGRPVLPGITPVALYGHTPGHVGYKIVSRGQSLFDMGDIVQSSIISLAKPDWTVRFDADKVGGARLRRTELQKLAAAHQRWSSLRTFRSRA
jgi:glyoxylase-like metal-dependent hydrolase (beta-lactamase superfamily II)